MKKKIAFVTIASSGVGMGHLVRSLSLAEMIQDKFEIKFIIDTDKRKIVETIKNLHYEVDQIRLSGIVKMEQILQYLDDSDIVVLDFYGITAELQFSLKEQDFKLVCIDDLHETHFYADAVINVSNSVKPADYSREKYTQLYLGTDYALLRPIFLQMAKAPQRKITSINSIFINMGGADLPNNTLKFLRSVLGINTLNKIHVVVGAVNPHVQKIKDFVIDNFLLSKVCIYHDISSDEIKNILLECQLAICPASGIVIEMCSIGMGIVSGRTADNQKDLLKGLIEKRCAFSLGDFNLLMENEITTSIREILSCISEINAMVSNQKVLVDGHSPRRLKKIFNSI